MFTTRQAYMLVDGKHDWCDEYTNLHSMNDKNIERVEVGPYGLVVIGTRLTGKSGVRIPLKQRLTKKRSKSCVLHTARNKTMYKTM